MTKRKKTPSDATVPMTRKEFLSRMSYGALGIMGLACGSSFGLGFSMGGSGSTCSWSSSQTSHYLIVNARLVDGRGGAPVCQTWIRIKNGMIAEIGRYAPPYDLPVIDVKGATVMPGLIDSHVHLAAVPGLQFRGDDEDTIRRYRYHHLKAYLASGVTTVLETGISAKVLIDIQDHLSAGGAGPRVFALGPPFTQKTGYIDDSRFYSDRDRYFYPAAVNTESDVLALFREFEDIPDIVGTKVFIEYGFGIWDVWPVLSPEIRKIIVRESEKRDLPVYVHAMSEDEQVTALEMNPKTMAHVGFLDASLPSRHIERLFDAGVYVGSTQVIPNLMNGEFHPEWWDTETARLTVPEAQILTAKNKDAWKQCNDKTYDIVVPQNMWDYVEDVLYTFRRITNSTYASYTAAALRKMDKAGIPITMGSDSGGLPYTLNYFHGFSSILELEYMIKAGMSLSGVLQAATRIPSEMLGISDRIGTVEPGKYADLIVLGKDPLADDMAYRSILLTIKDGVAKTPEEWMTT
jgi:imidazolonepropionase-like amidohydrolase